MLELGDLEMDDSNPDPDPKKKKKEPEPEGLDLGGLDLGDLELAGGTSNEVASTPEIKPGHGLDLGGLELGDMELGSDVEEVVPQKVEAKPTGEIDFDALDLTVKEEPPNISAPTPPPAETLDIGEVDLSSIEPEPIPQTAEAEHEIVLDIGEVDLSSLEPEPIPQTAEAEHEIVFDVGGAEVETAPAAPPPKPRPQPAVRPAARSRESSASMEKIQQRLIDLEGRKREAEQSDIQKEEFFVFRLDDRRFAVPYRHVSTVNQKHFVSPLFQGPECLAGIFPYEGGIITLIHLDRLMDFSPAERGIVVVLETEELKIGVLADAIDSMVALDPPVSPEPVRKSERAPKFVEGVLPTGEGTIYLLGVEQIMRSEAVWM